MVKKLMNTDRKPLIGFFPGFFDIGETYHLIKIAKCYQDQGGKVIIFSHGGDYEYLANEQGFEIIRMKPIAHGPDITRYFLEHSDEDIINLINEQISIYQKSGIKVLVQTSSYLDCLLTPYAAKVPLISIISGTLAPPYYKENIATYPEIFDNYLKRLVPQMIKNRINNWYTLAHKGPITRKFNRIAKKININKRFNCFHDIILGDHTLFCDDINFLGITPTIKFPSEDFIGPILSNEFINSEISSGDHEIEKHLNRTGKSILLTMGSSKIMKEIFLDILNVLNQTNYNVIATYMDMLSDDEAKRFNDNILLKKFIQNITELHTRVDLSIIHGGRGTVYNVAYSCKPAIGVPLNGEQQYNIESLVRHGTAKKVSKTFFKKEELLKAIEEIFVNYEKYLENAQTLANNLSKPEGDKKATQRIIEITKENM
jgi:UDP:flavonoid glycosyltransferase YjiC (YdhE family)